MVRSYCLHAIVRNMLSCTHGSGIDEKTAGLPRVTFVKVRKAVRLCCCIFADVVSQGEIMNTDHNKTGLDAGFRRHDAIKD